MFLRIYYKANTRWDLECYYAIANIPQQFAACYVHSQFVSSIHFSSLLIVLSCVPVPSVLMWDEVAFLNPLTPTITIHTAIIKHLCQTGLSRVKNYKWWLNPVWHRMLYSCTPTVGVKELIVRRTELYQPVWLLLLLRHNESCHRVLSSVVRTRWSTCAYDIYLKKPLFLQTSRVPRRIPFWAAIFILIQQTKPAYTTANLPSTKLEFS